jgi:hypothetical protein
MTTTREQIAAYQTAHYVSADRMASDLGTDTPTYRWWIAGYAPEGRTTWAVLKGLDMAAGRFLEAVAARKAIQPVIYMRHTARDKAALLLSVLTNRGLRKSEIARITGLRAYVMGAWQRSQGPQPDGESIYMLDVLHTVTSDLTGQERVTPSPHVLHPMLDELAARYELQMLINAADVKYGRVA